MMEGASMRFLVVTLKGPMMSFGGAKVDAHHVTRRHPGQSMVAGLIANALGYHHRDWERTQRLQRRLRYACRADRDGHVLEDYHTVDLGQEHLLSDRGWTTQGALEERAGGSASTTTHIRQRDYIADGVRTLVLRLEPARETPTLDDIHRALSNPERPLFIGRKCCVPSRPLVRSEGAFVHASSLEEALRAAPWPEDADADTLSAWWPATPADQERLNVSEVTDARDWSNQIHVGQRWLVEGVVSRRQGGEL